MAHAKDPKRIIIPQTNYMITLLFKKYCKTANRPARKEAKGYLTPSVMPKCKKENSERKVTSSAHKLGRQD
jgi:hypothetical protein